MALTPLPELRFEGGCPDCGQRRVTLPGAIPWPGDDFDWRQRDYDSFRLAMLEELAARFAERGNRWRAADMEVVLVEALAVVLDQLSDQLDRVQAEAFLETARRPESVRRLLRLIGTEAVAEAPLAAGIPDLSGDPGEPVSVQRARLAAFAPAVAVLRSTDADLLADLTPAARALVEQFLLDPATALPAALDAMQNWLSTAPTVVEFARNRALDRYWMLHPEQMERARKDGPRAIHRQRRMVTQGDYAGFLEVHPLVQRAQANPRWTGSWQAIEIALVARNNVELDTPFVALAAPAVLAELRRDIESLQRRQGLEPPNWVSAHTVRSLLREFLRGQRMAGQEVWLRDAAFVGIEINATLRIGPHFYASEIRDAARDALGSGVNGFFEPGRLRFGEDLFAGDVIEWLMRLDGVEAVCLNRFKRIGRQYPNEADAGRIVLNGIEIAVCDNDPAAPARGLFQVGIHGGRVG